MGKRLAFAGVLCALGTLISTGGASATSGALDSSFGIAGKAVVGKAGERITGWAGAVQSDGKAIIAGQARPNAGNADNEDVFLARLTKSGKLDPGFGDGGMVTTDLNERAEVGASVAITSTDDILVGGTDAYGGSAFVARYTADGQLDHSFGNGGHWGSFFFASGSYATREQVTALTVQDDGKIVGVVPQLNGNGAFAVFRLNSNGTFDSSFNGVGYIKIDDSLSFGYSIAQLPDGSFVVGGAYNGRMAAWKISSSGSLVSSFGSGGRATGVDIGTDGVDVSYGLVVQPSGDIVLAGGRTIGPNASSNEAFALERLTPSGSVDTTFGAQGLATVQISPRDDEIEALQQLPDGKLTAIGFTATTQTASKFVTQVAAARFSADGVIDKSFGGKGSVVIASGLQSFVNASSVLPDGRVLGFGYQQTASGFAGEVIAVNGTAPFVSSSPAAAAVGETVTLSGAGFEPSSTVKIGAVSVPHEDVHYHSYSRLDVDVPDNAVTGKLVVTVYGGTVSSAKPFGVLPTISDVAWDGPVSPGAQFGITGKTFVGVKSVRVGSALWKFKVDSPTHMTVTAPPAGALVSGALTITNAGGTATGPTLSTTVSISSFSPTSAKAGATLTIKGSGLGGGTVLVGGAVATVVSATGQQISVRVPATAVVGPIEVDPPSGSSVVTASDFKPLPVITGVSQGAVGETVTISGTNLADVAAVSFAGGSAGFTEETALHLTAEIPDGAPATGKWSLTTAGGSTTAVSTYALRPGVGSLSPSHAPAGTTITVAGTTFVGIKSVTVGGVTASFAVHSPAELALTIPKTALSGTIAVANAGGTGSSSGRFGVEPSLASFARTSGKAGDVLTISGTGLGAIDSVTFDAGKDDAVSATPSSVSATSVSVKVPAAVQAGPIEVSGGDGNATTAGAFATTPAASAASPLFAQVGGAITITGVGLTSAIRVTFLEAGYSMPAVSTTDTTVTATIPIQALGSQHVAVTLADGSDVEAYGSITVFALNSQTSQNQSMDFFDLGGRGLNAVAQVEFKSSDGGWVAASNLRTNDLGSEIDLTLPETAVSGPIRLIDADGDAAVSSQSFQVLRVLSLSESSWSSGDSVTVTGSGFTGAKVTVNGVSCPVASIASDGTSITFTMPTTPVGDAGGSGYTLHFSTPYNSYEMSFPKAA